MKRITKQSIGAGLILIAGFFIYRMYNVVGTNSIADYFDFLGSTPLFLKHTIFWLFIIIVGVVLLAQKDK